MKNKYLTQMGRQALLEQIIRENDTLKEAKSRYYTEHLYDFNKDVMGWPDVSPTPHKILCDFVEQPTKRKLILMPRGHLKSSCITIGYSCQQIAKNPNIRILICNATYQMAASFLTGIKKTLQLNEFYRELYGDKTSQAEKWKEDAITVPKITTDFVKVQPTVQVFGMGGNLVSQHYDKIIFDDIVNRDMISTKEQIDKTVLFYKDALDLLEPNGEFIIIGTRWLEDDLYGWIEKTPEVSKEFAFLEMKAITNYKWDEIGQVFTEGEVLFPNKFDLQKLSVLRREKGPYEFSCQYQNDPVPPEDQKFKKEWIQYYEIPDLRGEPLNKFTLIDPAISTDKEADFTAIVTIGVDKNSNIYILDIRRKQIGADDLIEEIFKVFEEYHPQKIAIEAVAFAKTLKPFAQQVMRERGIFLPIEEVKPEGNIKKELRISRLVPYYSGGKIFHNPDLPFNDHLEFELTHFPRNKNDDLIDALSYFPDVVIPYKQRMREVTGSRYLY